MQELRYSIAVPPQPCWDINSKHSKKQIPFVNWPPQVISGYLTFNFMRQSIKTYRYQYHTTVNTEDICQWKWLEAIWLMLAVHFLVRAIFLLDQIFLASDEMMNPFWAISETSRQEELNSNVDEKAVGC